MKGSVVQRLRELERRHRGPVRIVVLWPGDPEPEKQPNTIYLRVVYGKGGQDDGDVTEWAEK
ncbi:MAG: hypothetical protein KatS3mg050_1831 [Litorilinea sp.]|nr:MAG: hypothetical protein KatS3mg050_1831 [Litorilinea sp.]